MVSQCHHFVVSFPSGVECRTVIVGGWKTSEVSSLSFVAERRRFAMSFV